MKFGKCKDNRGKRVKGSWVFGGCEYLFNGNMQQYVAGKIFAIVVPDRNWDTLKPIIAKWIKPGQLFSQMPGVLIKNHPG